ncbi:ERCC1 family protein [Megaselia abdita]
MEDDDFDEDLANISLPSAPKVSKPNPTTVPSEWFDDTFAVEHTSSAEAAPQNTLEFPKPPITIKQPEKKLLGPSGIAPVIGSSKSKTPNPRCVLVNPKQRLNPALRHVHNVPMEFCDSIIPDFVVGRTSCILYLSLKYHALNPDYIFNRLRILGKQYELRVLLVVVDTPDPTNALLNLTMVCLTAELTLMLAWSDIEAGTIIENYKLLENKPPDAIMERLDSDTHNRVVSALTGIKSINKTDATTLLQHFGSLVKIVNASEEQLSSVAGLGPKKAKRLYKVFNEPFLVEEQE